MGTFKEMDPELAYKLIEGYEDALSTPAVEQDELYRKFDCPRCNRGLQREFDSRVGWKGDGPLPKFLLRCSNCNYTIDPHAGFVVRYGDASKVPTPNFIPIIGQK